MDQTPSEEKIIGIPKEKYLKVTYVLLLISSGFGLLSSLLGLVGMTVPLATLASLLGVAGVVLALLGLFVFSEQFKPIEQNHLKFMGFLFLAILVAGIVLGSIVASSAALVALVGLVLNVASLAAMYAGYRLYERGEEANKETVLKEIESFKSGLKSS